MLNPNLFRQPVVLFANGIGDHLLTLPTIRALSRLFQGRLTVVCLPYATDSFFAPLLIKRFVEFTARDFIDRDFFDADSLAERIGICDLLISLNPWHSSSVDRLIEILGVGETVGHFPWFKHSCEPKPGQHSMEYAFSIAQLFDPELRLQDFALPLKLRTSAIQFAEKVRGLVPAGAFILGVHADSRPNKTWPAERFSEFLNRFLHRHKDAYALLLGTHDSGIETGPYENRIIPCYGLSLDCSLALLQTTDVFLGVDSCFLHQADLSRVPGVGLFGPTSPAEFGFLFARHRHLAVDADISQIEVEEVLAATEEVIDGVRASTLECCAGEFKCAQLLNLQSGQLLQSPFENILRNWNLSASKETISLPASAGKSVFRVFLDGDTQQYESVIVKSFSGAKRRGFNEWACLEFLTQFPQLAGIVPKLFGGSIALHQIVLEDFGKHNELTTSCRDAIAENLKAVVGNVAKLHAVSRGMEETFVRIRDVFCIDNADSRYAEAEDIHSKSRLLSDWLASAGVRIDSVFDNSVSYALMNYQEPDGWLAFTHGDLGFPTNCSTNMRGQFFDLEWGLYRHSLTDLAHLYLMSTLPDEVMNTLPEYYFRELSKLSVSCDWNSFESHLAAMCSVKVIDFLSCFSGNSLVETSISPNARMQVVPIVLNRFLAMTQRFENLIGLRDVVQRFLESKQLQSQLTVEL